MSIKTYNTSANFSNISGTQFNASYDYAKSSTVTGSGQYNPSYAVTNLIDGTTTSYWYVNSVLTPHWVKFHLISAVNLKSIALSSASGGYDQRLQSFVVLGSNNDSDWTQVYSGTTGFTGVSQRKTFNLDYVGEYSYYKIQDTANQALVTLGEVELYDTQAVLYGNGESLIHDSGVLYSDPSAGFSFDNSTADDTTASLTVLYKYADYTSVQSWSTASEVDANADWNENWLTIAQLQAELNPLTRTYRYLKVQTSGTGFLEDFSIDVYTPDLTPPSDVSAKANAALSGEGTTYDLVTTFTGGTDTGSSGYAGANLEIEIDGTSYFQQLDGSFDTDETFSNLLLKGTAETRSIAYALGELVIPDRFRLNSWDNAGNYNRGDWSTFAEADLDNILSSAGGNYLDTNLTPSNVKKDVTYGVDETGTYDPTGSLPTLPTITVEDQRDGTGATVTIAGGETNATNTIYYMALNGESWITAGTRTGNGAFDLAITSPGNYWVTVKTTIASGSVCTSAQKFWVSDTDVDQQYRTDNRDRLRDMIAAKALQICKTRGVLATFKNIDDDSIKVYCIFNPGSKVTDILSNSTSMYTAEFEVPRQPGFIPTEISTAATIEYNDITYRIKTVRYTNEDLDQSPVVIFDCEQYEVEYT